MIKRRLLINAILATGATLAIAPSVLAKRVSILPKTWDKKVNILIIGTGYAGLAAAIEAHDKGAKGILVIDKMMMPGGNSVISGGNLTVPGCELQTKNGVEDNPKLMFDDIMKAGGYINNPKLAKLVADNSVDNYNWCKDHIGVKFQDRLGFHGGHSVKRSLVPEENSGSGIIKPMLNKLASYGIKPQLRTKLEEFYVVDNEVKGGELPQSYDSGFFGAHPKF